MTKLNAALWWATQAEISDGDLHRDRAYARLGIAYFSGKGERSPRSTRAWNTWSASISSGSA
ncbi:hypothetical protein [Streptomyces clavuligerus]|uniref:hypothetical protein n=1 Tax=Streptomyces clavuligerus TaxID=1901 RepID=UPI001F0772B1|nr:hypothetical protein [Streptomyces clavuligerus]